ncbi:MAG: hypothetical protein PHV82_11350 [Victivallaceae bacterium]|nr:hypothetical protein [Victivallaceae bacterium]
MYEELLIEEQGFSWSLSRESLFAFCPRAYFYHYYGSRGGFEQFSGAELLYQLKHIRSLDLWLNSICTAVLREFFYDNPENFNIRRAASRYFRDGMRSVSLREWRDDPRRLNLFEACYGEAAINELEESGAKLLGKYIDSLTESGLTDYLAGIPYLKRKIFSFPVSADIDGIRVWLSPALVWEEDGLLKFLTLSGAAPTERKMRDAGTLHKIYAFNVMRIKPEHAVTLNFDLSSGETRTVPDEEINIGEFIGRIKNSSYEMLYLLTEDSAIEGNFIKNSENCPKCRFKKYCERRFIFT